MILEFLFHNLFLYQNLNFIKIYHFNQTYGSFSYELHPVFAIFLYRYPDFQKKMVRHYYYNYYFFRALVYYDQNLIFFLPFSKINFQGHLFYSYFTLIFNLFPPIPFRNLSLFYSINFHFLVLFPDFHHPRPHYFYSIMVLPYKRNLRSYFC